MSTVTAATTHPSIDVAARKGLVWLPDWAMIRAERQKLSKRRGLMAAAVILSVGSMIVTFGILIALHASNAVKYGPAGGISHLSSVSTGLFQVAAVVAILVGATAGAGDLAVGFFRNLAVTGRSRLSLFLARIPGGLMVLLPIMAVAFAVVAECLAPKRFAGLFSAAPAVVRTAVCGATMKPFQTTAAAAEGFSLGVPSSPLARMARTSEANASDHLPFESVLRAI